MSINPAQSRFATGLTTVRSFLTPQEASRNDEISNTMRDNFVRNLTFKDLLAKENSNANNATIMKTIGIVLCILGALGTIALSLTSALPALVGAAIITIISGVIGAGIALLFISRHILASSQKEIPHLNDTIFRYNFAYEYEKYESTGNFLKAEERARAAGELTGPPIFRRESNRLIEDPSYEEMDYYQSLHRQIVAN
jgi:hypothetical protein